MPISLEREIHFILRETHFMSSYKNIEQHHGSEVNDFIGNISVLSTTILN